MKVIASGKFNASQMEFKPLTEEDQIEMKELHKEWFPIDYP